MQNSLKYILLCLSCLCLTSLAAQESKDSTAIQSETESKAHYRDIGFSAADYTLQKRYRPTDENFVAERFIDNTFISLTGEIQQLVPVHGYRFSMQYAVGGNIGKWINRYNAIRLGASAGTFVQNIDHARLFSAGVEADHMFNLTSYLWGYRRERFCEWSTVAGLGYRFSYHNGTFEDYFNVHLGMNLSMKTGRNVDLFFEPLAYLQGNDVARLDDMNWKNYNLSPGLKVGLTYVLQPREYKRPPVNYLEDSFISFAAGGQFQHNDAVYNEIGLYNSIKPHYMLSFGKTYKDGFGFRTSLTTSSDLWERNAENRDMKAKYVGMRLEAMYDFMSLIPYLRDDFPFSASLLLGPEAGILKKEDIGRKIRDTYVGATGGFQAKYRFMKMVSVFLEPRFSVLFYSEGNSPEQNKTEKRSNLNDILFNCNLGLQLELGPTSEGIQNLRSRAINDEFVANRFIDNTFISVTGEALQLLPVNGRTFSTQYAVGGNIGKWLDQYNAIRLGASAGTLVRNTDHARLYTLGGEIDHMFNISSYLWGYRRARFLDASTVAGLGYRLSRHNGSFEDYLNLHLGLNFAMKAGKDMDLFFEPLAYFQGDDMIWKNGQGSSLKHKIDPRNYIFAPALKVGLTYIVQPKEYKRPKVDYLDDSFISLAVGGQFQHYDAVFNEIGLLKSMKPHFMFSFGKFYRDGFGFRTSLTASSDIWRRNEENQNLDAKYIGMRLEAMYDLMSLNRNLREDFPFSASLLLGPEAGILQKKDIGRNIRDAYVGATGGIQAKYRLSDLISVFLEPRFSALFYSEGNNPQLNLKEKRSNLTDVLFNCNLGLEMALSHRSPGRRYMDSDSTYRYIPADKFVAKRFFDNTFISLTGEALQLLPANGSTYSTQYAVGGNIGKWIDPYNAIRLGASIGTFVRNKDGSRLYNIGAEADYMFNFTSYMRGYSQERFCDVSAVAGLGYRISRLNGSYKDYFNLHLGLNFAMKAGKDMDLFIEPLAYIQGDDVIWKNIGGSTWKYNLNPMNYIMAPALKVGLTYVIQPKDGKRPKVDYLEDSFISVGAGVQFEHSGMVLGSIGMLKSLRPHVMLSFGKIYKDDFGFRTSVIASRDIWKVADGNRMLKAKYAGLRLEAMYDLLKLNKNLKEDFPFSLSLLMGPEAGILSKEDVPNSISQVYAGATGGLQAKYRLGRTTSLFIEPRASAIMYSGSINSKQNPAERVNYKDLLFNCNFGVEVALGNRRTGKYYWEKYPITRYKPVDSFISERFFDNTFISLTGESQQLLPSNGSTYSTQYAVGGNIGKWINRYNAIRLGGTIGTFVKNVDGSRIYNIGGEVDHMFNITSFMRGYSRERFCDISTVVGVGYRISRRNGSYKDYLNAHAGLNVAMKVGRDFDIFFEPLAYIQGDDMIWKNMSGSSWMYNLNPKNYLFAPALKVGLTCNIQPKEHKRPRVNYLEDSFISVAGGVQFEHSSLVFNSLGMMKSLRPQYILSFGKIYESNFGFRTSIANSNDIWKVGPDNQKLKASYTSLRVEAMYDLMKLNRNLKEDFPFSLSVLLGPEAGRLNKSDVARDIRHVYVGATGGLQAKYRIARSVSLFVEPRFTGTMYSSRINSKQNPAERANYIDVLFNCNFGVEVSL